MKQGVQTHRKKTETVIPLPKVFQHLCFLYNFTSVSLIPISKIQGMIHVSVGIDLVTISGESRPSCYLMYLNI